MGSFDKQQYHTVITGTYNKFQYFFEGRYFKTNGWRDNSYEKNKLLHMHGKYNFDNKTSLGLHLNYAPLKSAYPSKLTLQEWRENPRQTNKPWGIVDSWSFTGALTFDKTFTKYAATTKSNDKGIAEFMITKSGLWLITVRHKIPYEDSQTCDYHVFRYTLTFNLDEDVK
ncbi:MAG: hypothetical protein N2202_09795 [Proteobacteria bacterium]|nr:hypothetical protein [Pseudomonadota bacterium]